jgi:hypothetical protein
MTTTRHADREFLAQLSARVEQGGSTGEQGARTVLAAGRHGLEFFRLFGPPYARFTGNRQHVRRDFRRRYDSHADIAFGPLREDGERFGTVHSGLSDSAVALRNHGEAVFSSWQGGAADSVAADLTGLLADTAALRARFARLARTVSEVVDRADRAVHEMATATSRLYADHIDRHNAADVRFLVDFHHRVVTGDNVDDDELMRAGSLCGIVSRPTTRTRQAILTDVTTAAGTWLHNVFVPAYEARVAAFDRICDTADEELTACWRTLGDALDWVLDPDGDRAPKVAPPAPGQRQAPAPEDPADPRPATAAAAGPSSLPVAGESGGTPLGGVIGGGGDQSGAAARDPLPSGVLVGATPATQAPTRGAAVVPAARSAAEGAGLGTAPGMFGGQPMVGGGEAQRHTVDVPLAGLNLTNSAVDAGFVLGGSGDQAVYNDAILEEAEAARKREELVPVAGDFDDDLW